MIKPKKKISKTATKKKPVRKTKVRKFSEGGKSTALKEAFESGMKDLKKQNKAAHKKFQDNPTKRALANLLATEKAIATHEKKYARNRIDRDTGAFFEYLTAKDLEKYKKQILKNNGNN
tara:strand:+ start:167 stop:523 length:357 start_codon:yes stop_codon:yes gene_type:complete